MYKVVDYEELLELTDASNDILYEWEGCDEGEFLIRVGTHTEPVEVIAYDGWYSESPEDMKFRRSLGWIVNELNRAKS